MAQPTHHLTHPSFTYCPAAKTDITKTWRKFGWKPLAEIKAEEPKRRQIRVIAQTREGWDD